MNTKILAFSTLALLGAANTVSAKPQFIDPASPDFTGATSCTQCHGDDTGATFKIPVFNMIATFTSHADEIAKLTTYIKSLSIDTAPVIKGVNLESNMTVGELPLTIPVSLFDAENDLLSVGGSSTLTGMKLANMTAMNTTTHLSKLNLKWAAATAAQAGSKGMTHTFTLNAKESAAGRTLAATPVTGKVYVWPARANKLTAKTSDFSITTAKWAVGKLTLSGKVTFKGTATAADKTAVLGSVLMNVNNAGLVAFNQSSLLTPAATGVWTKTFITSTVPCSIVAEFDGLKARRAVTGAPAATCLK